MPRIVALNLGAGSRLPAWCTSMGRVLLASLPVAEREAHVPAVLNARTPKTLRDRPSLMAVLDHVRAEGYCILDEELELGLRSLAVPVTRGFYRAGCAFYLSDALGCACAAP